MELWTNRGLDFRGTAFSRLPMPSTGVYRRSGMQVTPPRSPNCGKALLQLRIWLMPDKKFKECQFSKFKEVARDLGGPR